MVGRPTPPDDDREWEDAEDPEGPQECDLVAPDEDETPTVPCPSCRSPIPEFVDHCPYCGDWFIPSSGDSTHRSPWPAVFIIVCVAALLFLWVF
jgi:hypothetical protein